MGRTESLLLRSLIAVACLLRATQLPLPFAENDLGWGGAFYSLIARNHLRHGFLFSWGAPFTDPGLGFGAGFPHLYLNHPPLTGWLVALSFSIFGEHEWSARLVPLAFSIGSIPLLYRLIRLDFGKDTALRAAFLFSILPMGTYYGPHLDVQGSLVIFFLLLAVWRHRVFVLDPARTNTVAFVLALLAGLLTDWPAHYLVILLPLLHRLVFHRKPGRAVWTASRLGGLAILAMLGYIAWQGGLFGLIGEGLHRSSSRTVDDPLATRHLPVWRWTADLALRWGLMFSPVALGLSLLGMVSWRKQARDETWKVRHFSLIILWAVAMLHVLLWRQGAWFHAYWSCYALAPVAGTAALALSGIHSHRGKAAILLLTALWSLGAWGYLVSRPNYTTAYWKEFGETLRASTAPDDIICIHQPVRVMLEYYADRRIIRAGGPDEASCTIEAGEDGLGSWWVVPTGKPFKE